jgi:hypothetical protein
VGRAVLLLVFAACRVNFDELQAGDAAPADQAGPGDGAGADGPMTDGGPDAALVCPGTYVTVAGETSKYRAVNNSSDWLSAEQACEAEGTHLWIPDTAAEIAMMTALLPAQNLWTGITDRRTVGQWLRVTGGTHTFLPWEAGEPDLSAPECVRMDGLTTQLVDQGCSSGGRYICECDGAAADPTA